MLFKTVLVAALFTGTQAIYRGIVYHCQCHLNGEVSQHRTTQACNNIGRMHDGVCVVMEHLEDDFHCNEGAITTCTRTN
ncbi:hypothetical protein LX36DRAFT_224812 [Colletotrichum falcatum]|nr:hypothetical protein LX36DRAFT_224812 [Colletotrichum falcatum]